MTFVVAPVLVAYRPGRNVAEGRERRSTVGSRRPAVVEIDVAAAGTEGQGFRCILADLAETLSAAVCLVCVCDVGQRMHTCHHLSDQNRRDGTRESGRIH